MTLNIKLTIEEVNLLASLAADQLFRMEFINPKIPGYRSNSSQINLGKALVVRLRSTVNPGYGKDTMTRTTRARVSDTV